MIEKIQRRPTLGQWHSCLYKLTGIIWEIVKKVTIEFITIINRVASTRHIVSKNTIVHKSTAKKSDFPIKLKDPPRKSKYDLTPWVPKWSPLKEGNTE